MPCLRKESGLRGLPRKLSRMTTQKGKMAKRSYSSVTSKKRAGIQIVKMREIRQSTGPERDQWRLAMQAEVDSLRDTGSFEAVSAADLKTRKRSEVLPMKLVTGIKHDAATGTSKKKVRAVVCGNFQPKSEGEDLYTANADITSVRTVLAEGAARKMNVKVLDVKTAFLNASLPSSFEAIYVRPPQALVEFGIVEPDTIWRLWKAVYGLRISPKAWGPGERP